ncbi:AfsR/SARP family transcriptional regulator [Dactylosporangium sp. CA-092794]|uniref:AfsR/SARP family transcriptional regulator n=1 Tax=Dactylosporangium sp. CA-092794 TaxID=3239929 RepID=UPI003D8E755B
MAFFKVLGSLEVLYEKGVCTPTAPKVRRVLAHLLMNANQIVHIDSLIDELWAESPPLSATTTTQTYIYQLRKLIAKKGLAADGEMLVTRAPGYLLRVRPGQLDADRFTQLTTQGRALLDKGMAAEASDRLRTALDLWTGPPLSNVTLGNHLRAYAAYLEEERLRATELRIEADIRLGRYRELIGELRSLVIAQPLNEWFHRQLIGILTQCGRRNEALQAYQNLRAVLNDELGLEPSAEVQLLHRDILAIG